MKSVSEELRRINLEREEFLVDQAYESLTGIFSLLARLERSSRLFALNTSNETAGGIFLVSARGFAAW
jgi:hypothetical protein